jgi:hypothetical protein
MKHGIKALTVAAIMLTQSTSAHALAWRVEGYLSFFADVAERDFYGQSIAEYSARITEKDLEGYGNSGGDESAFDYLYPLPAKFVTAFDSINGGPWLTSTPTIFLSISRKCASDDDASCRPDSSAYDFLMPEAGMCWVDCVGQFEWFSVPGEGSYAWLPDGTYCDWDTGCSPDGTDWDRGRESAGTVEEVPEPKSLALLGLGMAGLGFLARRRKAA